MWWSIGGGIIIFALGMFIFLKPGLIWIGGILFALFGIIMIMLPVILE